MNRMLPALLVAIALAAPVAAQPAASFAERLSGLSDVQRRAVLRGALVNSGERCGRVDRADPRGRYRNLVIWNVRCVPGGDYGVFVGPDGSAQIRTCTDLAKLRLPPCALPPAAAAPPRPGRR